MVRKHKPYTGLKVYSTIISLLLIVAIILTGCAFGLNWVQITPSDDVIDEPEQDEESEDQQGGMIIGTDDENNSGISLMSTQLLADDYDEYGVSTLAETAYTLTATITPSYATEKTVDWAVAFADPSSDWATGKTVTDYVTVTPTSDGALTAVVECKNAFGEQIIVTCSLRNNAEFSATCTVDYAKKVVSVTPDETWFVTYNDGVSLGIVLDLFIETGTLVGPATTMSVFYSDDYTVDDTFELTVTIDGDSDFEAYLTSGGVEGIEHYSGSSVEIPYLLEGLFTDSDQYSSFYNIEDDDLALAYELAIEYLADNPVCEITLSYHGSYSDYEVTFPYYFADDALLVYATGVNLGQSSMLF